MEINQPRSRFPLRTCTNRARLGQNGLRRLVDEHVELPKEGRALYIRRRPRRACTGFERNENEQLTCCVVDETLSAWKLRRPRPSPPASRKPSFNAKDPQQLSLKNDQFDLVLGDASLTPPSS